MFYLHTLCSLTLPNSSLDYKLLPVLKGGSELVDVGLGELNLQLKSRLVSRKMSAHATASERCGLDTCE